MPQHPNTQLRIIPPDTQWLRRYVTRSLRRVDPPDDWDDPDGIEAWAQTLTSRDWQRIRQAWRNLCYRQHQARSADPVSILRRRHRKLDVSSPAVVELLRQVLGPDAQEAVDSEVARIRRGIPNDGS